MKHATKNIKIQNPREAGMFHVSCFRFHEAENGVTLAFALIVLSNMLLIALTIGIFSVNQLKITASARDSAYAIFAATTGLERALYQARKENPNNCGNINLTTMAPNLQYSVIVSDGASGNCPSSTNIASIGTYKQTSRKIDASW